MKWLLPLSAYIAFALIAFAQLPQTETWRMAAAQPLVPDLHHVQGIDIEGDTLWVSSVDRKTRKGFVSKLSRRSGKLLAQVEVQVGAMFHPGGLALDGDSLWVPVAEYDRDGPSQIQRRNKRTLALEASFAVDDHIGCIAASQQTLVGGNWSSRTLYQWDKQGQTQWKKPNPFPTHWQDLKFAGKLLIGSGIVPGAPGAPQAGAVEWVQLPSLTLVRRIQVGETARKVTFAHEGMAWIKGELFLLPEDYPTTLYRMQRK